MKIVIDTNILIDFSRGNNTNGAFKNSLWLRLIKYCKREGHQLMLPSISVFEYFSGEEMNNKKNQEKAGILFKDFQILNFNEEIAKIAAGCFRKYKKSIDVLDYLIAATVINIDGELATLNSKHFKIFDDLKLFDFKKLDKV